MASAAPTLTSPIDFFGRNDNKIGPFQIYVVYYIIFIMEIT